MNPKDIFIAKIKLPNDPTGMTKTRQFVVIKNVDDTLLFLTVASIGYKIDRVYGSLGKINGIKINAIFDDRDIYGACGFNFPSYIDCTCIYRLSEISRINIEALDRREMTPEAWDILKNKLNEVGSAGLCNYHDIDLHEFVNLNRRLRFIEQVANRQK